MLLPGALSNSLLRPGRVVVGFRVLDNACLRFLVPVGSGALRLAPGQPVGRIAAGLGLRLFQHRHQRIEGLRGIDVEHETVSILAHRWQIEYTRLDLGLEVEHETRYTRLEAPGTQCPDVGVGGRDLGPYPLQHAVDIHVLQIEHQSVRVLKRQKLILDRGSGFERDARVFFRRPNPRGADCDGGEAGGNTDNR